MSGIWHQWSVLYLNFCKRLEYLIHHCDCVCWCACYSDTALLKYGYVGIETRSGHLASVILVNTLLYPTSVSDCPWTSTWCPHYPNHLTSKKSIYFNLLSSCLHPHNPTTHTTKPHIPEPDTPATVCHIVIILIIFLWYKTIFPTDPHCVSLYVNKEKQKKSKQFPV